MGFEAGDVNVSRYVGNGVASESDPTGLEERPLTLKEKQFLEYMFRAVLGKDEMIDITAVISKVRMIDGTKYYNPLVDDLRTIAKKMQEGAHSDPVVSNAVNVMDRSAITRGYSQYYKRYPKPDDVTKLPLMAHETMQSIDFGTDPRGVDIAEKRYLMESGLWYGKVGEGYRAIETELRGYSMQYTVVEMFKDPIFMQAAVDGKMADLDPAYVKRVHDQFWKEYQEAYEKYRVTD